MKQFDVYIGLLGILPLVVALLNVHHFLKSIQHILLWILITVSFIAGSLDMVGISGFFSTVVFLDVMTVLLFLTLLSKSGQVVFLHSIYVILFVVTCLVSMVLNDTDLVGLLLFLRKYLLPFVLFWAIYNASLSNFDFQKVIRLIYQLSVAQIIIAVIKFAIVGQTEIYIGSLASSSGDVSTIFALFGISYAFSKYLSDNKLKYIFLTFLFMLFALINEKRALIGYAPLLIIILTLIYSKRTGLKLLGLKNIIIYPLAIAMSIYLIIILNPTLNPQQKIGGDFNLNYSMTYITDYLYPDRKIYFNDKLGAEGYGRLDAPMVVMGQLSLKKGLQGILCGFGPGELVMSQYKLDRYKVRNIEELAAVKFNVGYGVRTGLLTTWIQAGFFGALFLFLFYWKLFRMVKKVRPGRNIIPEYYATMGFFVILLFDFVSYSVISLTFYPLLIFLYVFITYILKNKQTT